MIAIIDYGMGNVRSVYNALSFIGEDAVITSDPAVINNASHLILPGVGAFGDAMRNLEERGLITLLQQQAFEKAKPILGICLGLQIMAGSSEEHGIHEGLGWFDAKVIRFELADMSLKVPHVGWNEVNIKIENPLFKGLKDCQNNFYFVHGYHLVCNREKEIAATCDYGYTFTAAVCRNNITAVQFHPEKSQDSGLKVLQNFTAWNPEKC